jgi:linoleoyl-CoA desaturase
MRTIQYRATHVDQALFGAAVRARVQAWFKERGLSMKGDRRMVAKTIIMLLLYLVPFAAMLALRTEGPWSFLAWSIMGLGLAGLGMTVMHDAAHNAVSERPWVNRMLSWTMYLFGGNVFVWKVRHNILHHTHTNIPGTDEDIAAGGPLRFNELSDLRPIHRFQHVYAFAFYGIVTAARIFSDLFMILRLWRGGVMRQLREPALPQFIWALLSKALYLIISLGLPLLISPSPWWEVLLGWSMMHFIAGLILGTVFQLSHLVQGAEQPMLDERGVIPMDWVLHEMRTTVNFNTSCALLDWYIGGLNRQVEHHLFPQMCHVHYAEIAPMVKRTAEEFGVEYKEIPSFRAALASHVKRLKELGTQVGITAEPL